ERLREALGQLDESAVIDRIGAAVENADAAEVRIKAAGMPVERDRPASCNSPLNRHFREQIDVACPCQMLAAHAQVAHGERIITTELPLDIEAPLMRKRLHVIWRECIDVGRSAERRRS